MKYKFISYFLVCIFILLAGCASTSITSFVDPDYRAVHFKNILIVSNTNKLGDRLSLENRIVELMVNNGIIAIPSYSIFPPTREFSDEQKKEIMSDNKIDGCLMINFGERGVQEISIPVTGSNSQTQAIGNKIFTSTQYIGGQTFSEPYAEFELKLYDVINGKMAWRANSYTGGSAYSNFNTVYSSFCNKIIKKLSEDKLISTIDDLNSEIIGMMKARRDNEERNKTDVLVLKNGIILKGIILNSYISNKKEKYYIEMQTENTGKQKIFVKDISEVYQK